MQPEIAVLPESWDEPLVAALLAMRQAADAARDPDVAPIGPRELHAQLMVARPEQALRTFAAWRGDEVVGLIAANVLVEGANVGYGEVEVDVHPAHRRGDVERALVDVAMPWMRDQGARTLAWWPWDELGDEVAASLGLTLRQKERCSRLLVADVDDDQQDEWIAAPRARAAGYTVEHWTGACPDDLVVAYAEACSAMADAPLDDIDFDPAPISVERIRESERIRAATGKVTYVALARDPDGAAAGMSAILIVDERPEYGHQEDTAVVATHRGHALGRWLKAANLRRVREAVPEMRFVETYNAASNPWMLAINVDMGFRPHRTYSAYQADIDAVGSSSG